MMTHIRDVRVASEAMLKLFQSGRDMVRSLDRHTDRQTYRKRERRETERR